MLLPPAPFPCRDELRRKVEGGTTLVVDRYAYSGAAYTAAKGCPGLDLEWCRAQDRGLPRPDAIFFLSLTPEQAQARGGYGEERYEKVGVAGRACVGCMQLGRGAGCELAARGEAPAGREARQALDPPWLQQAGSALCPPSLSFFPPPPQADFQQAVLQQFQLLMDPSWRVVDAGQSIEAVQAQLQEAAEGVVQRVQASNAPLGMLWDEPSPLHTEQPLVDIANTNTRRPR